MDNVLEDYLGTDSGVNFNSQSFICERSLDPSKRTISGIQSFLDFTSPTPGTSENPNAIESFPEKPSDPVLGTLHAARHVQEGAPGLQSFMERGVNLGRGKRRCGFRRETVDRIHLNQEMTCHQNLRVPLSILDTSGGHPSETHLSGRDNTKIPLNHIFDKPETSGVMLTFSRTLNG